ncbi:MAG: hypothetical protein J5766_05015 [Clostridia bacterium]|nr:hypothetical protein [Clostridia bacterium]
MKKGRVLKIVIIVFALFFVGHQLYAALYSPITTESAEYYVADEGISAKATIIRQETIVTSDAAGSHHFRIQNGSRVSKNGVLADIYANDSDSLAVSKLDNLNERISDLEEITGYNDASAADISLIRQDVVESVNDYVRAASTGDYFGASDYEKKLLFSINRKQFVTGETTDFSGQLEALKAEQASLSASQPAPVASLRSAVSGYFVSSVDGYENVLTTQKLDEITPEKLEGMKPESAPENVVGKIASDDDWCIAVTLSVGEASKYKVDDDLLVKLKLRNNSQIDVKVKQINVSSKADKAVVLMSCLQMNKELASVRTADINIVSREYKGLKLSRKALRVVKGQSGVYVVSGMSLKFVKVDVIYSTDDYIVCKQEETDNKKVLRLYDEVVVKGKNLYEGKIIS